MKQWIKEQSSEFLDKPEFVRNEILAWKKRKYPFYSYGLNLGMCFELLIAYSPNLKLEDSSSRFFNKLVVNEESMLGWDGDEAIDIVFYEATEAIKRRLVAASTFNDEIAS